MSGFKDMVAADIHNVFLKSDYNQFGIDIVHVPDGIYQVFTHGIPKVVWLDHGIGHIQIIDPPLDIRLRQAQQGQQAKHQQDRNLTKHGYTIARRFNHGRHIFIVLILFILSIYSNASPIQVFRGGKRITKNVRSLPIQWKEGSH